MGWDGLVRYGQVRRGRLGTARLGRVRAGPAGQARLGQAASDEVRSGKVGYGRHGVERFGMVLWGQARQVGLGKTRLGQDRAEAENIPPPRISRVIYKVMMELGFALWILIAPLDFPGAWDWTIVGGPYDSQEKCEWARTHRLDATLCVRMK